LPKHRPPKEIRVELRRRVWQRDRGFCQGPYCQSSPPLSLRRCHIDHIHSGKLADNSLRNLRVLCRRCHVLRADPRHRGMIAAVVHASLIPPDWRRFAWAEDSWPPARIVAEMQTWADTQPLIT
jgi:hypothetical protein